MSQVSFSRVHKKDAATYEKCYPFTRRRTTNQPLPAHNSNFFFFRSTVAVASSTFRDYIKLSIHQQRAKHMHASLQACTVLRFLRLGGLEFTYYYRPRIFTASKVSIVNLLASYIFQNTQSLNT